MILNAARMSNREIIGETFQHFSFIKSSKDKHVPLGNADSKLTLELLGKRHQRFSSVFLVNCAQVFIYWNISNLASCSNETREIVSQYCFACHEKCWLGAI